MNFNPTRDWLVLPIPDKTTTDSGIHLSDSTAASLRSNVLEVIAAGPDTKAQIGDKVMVHPQSEGVIVDIEGAKYVMVSEFMIIGIIPKQ